jgi:membrane protein implicated in regulation of membrane protease activity
LNRTQLDQGVTALASPPFDRDPSVLVWLTATASLLLPWIGGALLFAGVVGVWHAGEGWTLMAIGAAAVAIDVLIDLAWASPHLSGSDQPDLNRRGSELIGRIAFVETELRSDSGKVRIGDTVWPAALSERFGQKIPVGHPVRITALKGTSLIVEPDEPASPPTTGV